MIMAMEKGGNPVFNHQLVNRLVPAGPTNIKSPGSPVVVIASPLNVGHRIGTASSVIVCTSGHLMGKDKLKCGLTVFKCLLEPLVLVRSQGPIPSVAGPYVTAFPSPYISDIRFDGRVLERVNDNEECIAPLPGVVILGKMVTADRN